VARGFPGKLDHAKKNQGKKTNANTNTVPRHGINGRILYLKITGNVLKRVSSKVRNSIEEKGDKTFMRAILTSKGSISKGGGDVHTHHNQNGTLD